MLIGTCNRREYRTGRKPDNAEPLQLQMKYVQCQYTDRLLVLISRRLVDISEKIGTYETSIQPFEDCCTIFVAKHPVTKPNLNIIKQHEHNLDDVIDELMKTAIETTEKIVVK